jgi:serine/threonine-protein kinase
MPTDPKTGSVTVLGRLATTRGLTAYFLLVLATIPLVGVTIRQAEVRLGLPDVGLDVNAELGVECVDARWPDVKQHDRIVALDGVPLKDPADWVERALSHDDTPLVVTFERDDREFTSSAAATPIAWSDKVAVWARVGTAATLMAMGLVAFLLRPGIPTTWLLLLTSWDLGLFLLLKILLYFDPRFYKFSTIYPWATMTSVGLHFLAYFPRRQDWILSKPYRVWLLYGPVALAPVAHVLSAVTQMSGVATLWGAVAGILVVVVLSRQYMHMRSESDERIRSQYRALIVGFALGLVIPGIWNWLRLSLDVWNSPWAAHWNALPLVLFVGVTSYAVVKHNALAIDRFTAAVVGYGVTTIVLGAAFATALLGIPLLLDQSGLSRSPALLVGATALTFASFSPLHRRIKQWVDRRFFRERADVAQIAEALQSLVLGLQRADLRTAFEHVFAATGILQADRIQLWLLDKDGRHLHPGKRAGTGANDAVVNVSSNGALANALKGGATAGIDELCPNGIDRSAQDELWSHQLAMVSPVMVRGVLGGFLGVGRKRSGAPYNLEELSFLTIVAAQLGSALERLRSDATELGRYHLERRIGTGGMAEVFLAWQVGPGGFERKVAVKRPLPHVNEEPNAVAAFLDEARLAAQLQHPNIAQVFDVGENAGAYFIVMEFVDGPSLRQLLRSCREKSENVPLPVAAAIVLSVLSALGHAHEQKDELGRPLRLVHRDITPRNVLLNRRGEVKLVDFGIARAQFQLHVTQTGTVKGTLPYMSMEQASGIAIDNRSDLYSTAVVFYELLTGVAARPEGPGVDPPVAVSQLAEVPRALDAVLNRAMAFEPDARYATAGEQAQAILGALAPFEPATTEEVAAFLARSSFGASPPDALRRGEVSDEVATASRH